MHLIHYLQYVCHVFDYVKLSKVFKCDSQIIIHRIYDKYKSRCIVKINIIIFNREVKILIT